MLSLTILAFTFLFNPPPALRIAALAPTSFQTQPAPTAAQEDPAVTALARKIYAQMRAGKVDQSLLTPEMAKAFSPDQLAQTAPMFTLLGDPTRLTLQTREDKQSHQTPPTLYTVYTYLATFATAELHVQIVMDTQGKVAGYRVQP